MKHLTFMSATLSALALAACTSNSDLTQTTPPNPAEEETPVAFDTYVAKTANTRAAIDNLAGLKDAWFGVFAYYTEATDYNSNYTPNFMYNQSVTFSSNWTYTPIKYWPNEIANGAVDNQSNPAQGATARGKLSFFAYAPYNGGSGNTVDQGGVTNTNASATVKSSGTAITTGITKMSGYTYSGDPTLTYVLNTTNPENNVDLLWGTANGKTGSSYTNTAGATVSSTEIDSGTGEDYNVWKNCTKQKSGDALTFDFVHALAKIGTITIEMDPNNGNYPTGGTTNQFGNTKEEGYTNVTVNSIKLSYTGAVDGTFNLATGAWTAGTSGERNYTLNSNTLLNSDIYYDNSGDEPEDFKLNLPEGVTLSSKTVFGTAKPLIYFIPGSSLSLTVEVDYTLRTYDTSLSRGWTIVSQKISKQVNLGTLAINTNYALKIKLGVEDIDVSATYTEWGNGSDEEIYLPINVSESAASVKSGTSVSVSTTASQTSYAITVYGLTSGHTYSASISASDGSSASLDSTSGSFDSTSKTFNATISANTTGASRTFTVTITDTTADPDIVTTITVTQPAS